MMRLSPSIVDSYEFWRGADWMDEDRSEAALEELRSMIRSEYREPSDAQLLGRAWHEALESEPDGDTVAVEAEGQECVFDADSVRLVRRHQPAGLIREARMELELDEIDVLVRMRADGVLGGEVHEVKTTSRVDPERYVSSCQWRLYLLGFGVPSVIYHVCKLRRDRGSGVHELADYQQFYQYAYPGMREDVARRVGEVRDFVIDQGLAPYRMEA